LLRGRSATPVKDQLLCLGKGPDKLQSTQVPTVQIAGSDDAGTQLSHRPRQCALPQNGRRWNLERYLRPALQKSANRKQCAASTLVEQGAELQELLALLVNATHEDRNGKRKP